MSELLQCACVWLFSQVLGNFNVQPGMRTTYVVEEAQDDIC